MKIWKNITANKDEIKLRISTKNDDKCRKISYKF